MTRHWLFVDEQLEEAQSCAKLLAQDGELEVSTLVPEADVAFLRTAIDQKSFDGVLVDHALNEGRPEINYAGATLAAFIRTEYPDLPIVVLSARLKDIGELRRYRRTESLFDLRLDKQDLQLRGASIRKSLKELGDGYKRLKEVLSGSSQTTYPEACCILGIPDGIGDDTERGMVARFLIETGAGDPSRVAHFLLQFALRLPGPLLERSRAAVSVGLAPDSNEAIDAHIAPARYVGVFAGIHPEGRYWRDLLNELEPHGGDLAPARCVVCDELASDLCEVCKKPVDGLHSLPVHRNLVANDVFLRGRVCGFCLAGDLPDELSIDGRYARMRQTLVAEVQALQDQRL